MTRRSGSARVHSLRAAIGVIAPLAALLAAACAFGSSPDDEPAVVPQVTPAASAAPAPEMDTPSVDRGKGSSGAAAMDAATTTDAHADSAAPKMDASPTRLPEAGSDAGADAATKTCTGFASPNVQATCHSCGANQTCQANGCYNGYYCETATEKCKQKPASCP